MTREPTTLAALDTIRVPGTSREVAACRPKTRSSRRHNRRLDNDHMNRSDDADVLRLVAFAALGHVELDALTLLERTVTVALDGAEVHEDVGATIAAR